MRLLPSPTFLAPQSEFLILTYVQLGYVFARLYFPFYPILEPPSREIGKEENSREHFTHGVEALPRNDDIMYPQ